MLRRRRRGYDPSKLPVWRIRVYLMDGLWIYAGPWSARWTWPWTSGRFANGSRFHSGWFRWPDEPEY